MAKVRNLTIRITAAPRGLERQMLRTRRELRRLSRDVNGVNRDISRLGSTFGRVGTVTHVAGAGLGRLASGARTATVAMTGAAAAASALHGGIQLIGGLGASLAPLAGLLTAVPAAVAGAVAAFGTLKLATAGMGKAFSDAAKGDSKKFAEDLKKLAPAARDVARDFRAALPTLRGIQLVAQQRFFEPLRGQITAVTKALAGPLRNGVGTVAHEFGMAAREAARFAQSATAATAVKTILGTLATGLRTVRPAIQPLLTGFAQIATVGAKFLAGFAPAIASAATAFGNFLSNAASSGRALSWMQTGLAVAKQLGTLLGNIGGIIASVFRAAGDAGTNFLGTLGMLAAQLNQFLKSAAGQQALTSFFQALAAIGQTLGPVIAAVLTQVGNLAPAVGRLAQMIGPILTTAINAIAPALAALEPGLAAIFTALGQAVAAVAPALVPLAQAISQIVVAVAPLLPMIATLAAQFITALAPVVGQLATQLGPPLIALFASLMQTVIPLLPAIVKLAQQLGDQLVKILPKLTPQLVILVQEFAKILPIIGPLLPVITNLVIAILPLLPIVVPLAIAIKGMAIAFGLLNAALALSPLTLIIGAIAALAVGLVLAWQHCETFRKIVTGAWHAIVDAAGFLARLPGKVVGFFVDMVRGATDMMSHLISNVAKLPGLIGRALGNTGKMLYQAGKNILTGLWNGIASMAGKIAGWIGDMIRNIIPGPIRHVLGIASPSKVTAEIGRFVGQGLALGILSTQRAVSGAAAALANAAVPTMATPAMAGAPAYAAPSGPSMAGGARLGGIDYDALGAAVARHIEKRGLGGAVYLDGKLISENSSRHTGRRAQQQRRTS